MKNTAMWLILGIFVGLLSGCGDTINTVTQAPVAAEVKKSTIKVLDLKSQELQFVANENGSLKNLRVGGIIVRPEDVSEVVYVSYRFGNIATSPFRAKLDSGLKATFTGLPNNDDYGEYFVITKDGKSYKVELSQFTPIWKEGIYSFIDYDSSIQWGDIEAPSSQDGITGTLDKVTSTVTFNGSFGCDMLFGIKKQISFQPGLFVVFEETNGNIHRGEIVKDAAGNLVFTVAGIPAVMGPYGEYYGGKTPTQGTLYVLLPDGSKVEFCFSYNTDDQNESVYVWGLYFPNSKDSISIDTYSGQLLSIIWYPPYDPAY